MEMGKGAPVAKEKKRAGRKKKKTAFNFNKTKKPPSSPDEHTAASTKLHSNEIGRLGHTDFWAGRAKPAHHKTAIVTTPCDGATILPSTSSGGPSTENLGGENITYNNQTNILGCDRGNVILDFPSLKDSVQDHLCCKVCNSEKVESELGGFF